MSDWYLSVIALHDLQINRMQSSLDDAIVGCTTFAQTRGGGILLLDTGQSCQGCNIIVLQQAKTQASSVAATAEGTIGICSSNPSFVVVPYADTENACLRSSS